MGLQGQVWLFAVPATQEPRGRGERRTKSAIRNQVQIAVSGSLLPLREKARMRVRRAQARLCGRGRPRSRRKPTPISPSWEKARMRALRAQARLCARDARAPRDSNLPPLTPYGRWLGRVDINARGHPTAIPNPLDSRFRGNDGVKIGTNSATTASLRLRAFALNSLRQHTLAPMGLQG